MPVHVSNQEKLRTSYAALRTRLLAKRKIEETRLARVREALRRIDRELAALERERMRLDRSIREEMSTRAATARRGHGRTTQATDEDIARAAKQFASTATR